MAHRLLAIVTALGLAGTVAVAARADVTEIEAGGEATFGWSPATGPVDHYEVQVATEQEPPFNWSTFRLTAPDELSVTFSSETFGIQAPDVTHWTFDESTGNTIYDYTGKGHTGTAIGTHWITDTPNGSRSALSFDGSGSGVQIGPVNPSGNALTIALWFKADDFGISDARLISKAVGTDEADHYWMLSTVDSNGMKLRFRLKTNGVTQTLIASTGTIEPGVWTHAAAVYDGSTMRLFKDGVEVGVTSKTGDLTPGDSVNVAIGNQPSGRGEKAFDGDIDDVRLYSYPLSQPEIASIASGTGTRAAFVTVRTIAHDSLGHSSIPSANSVTVHFIPPVIFAYSVPDDFDGDSIPDVLDFDDSTGVVLVEESSTGEQQQVSTLTPMVGGWEIVARGDFDGDSREDLFWRQKFSGNNRIWLEVGANVIEEDFFNLAHLENVDAAWKVLASGDFDGDGYFDVFWQNQDTLETYVWFIEGTDEGVAVEVIDFPRLRSASWVLEATGDFDGNGTFDMIWRDLDSGRTALWLLDGESVGFVSLQNADLDLEVEGIFDFDQDGSSDLIWRNPTGSCEAWLMPEGERFTDIACPAAD